MYFLENGVLNEIVEEIDLDGNSVNIAKPLPFTREMIIAKLAKYQGEVDKFNVMLSAFDEEKTLESAKVEIASLKASTVAQQLEENN